MSINFQDIRVYCDEITDQELFAKWASVSKYLRQIPIGNITVYAQAPRILDPLIRELVHADRPDFIITYKDKPLLVLEVTEHGYTGDNPLQRFTRFATTAEARVPFLYFTPFARTRDDELDLSDDPSTLSKRKVNTDVFIGMLRLAEIFKVPQLTLEWEVGANGKPTKLGAQPTPQRILSIYGRLVEVLDIFVGELAERASEKKDLTNDKRIAALQEEVRQLTLTPNTKDSGVKLLVPGKQLVDLICKPQDLINLVGERYFFQDKPERLLALRCLQEARIEHVELQTGKIVPAADVRKQLSQVFQHPKFNNSGCVYYTGYKWRSDPHCGVAVNIDYIRCRSNNSVTVKDRDRALVLFYPRISLKSQSHSYSTVTSDLGRLDSKGAGLYELFDKRYGAEAANRRKKFEDVAAPLGLWRETPKQARIFRRYCDIIVLSDAVLIGDHWK